VPLGHVAENCDTCSKSPGYRKYEVCSKKAWHPEPGARSSTREVNNPVHAAVQFGKPSKHRARYASLGGTPTVAGCSGARVVPSLDLLSAPAFARMKTAVTANRTQSAHVAIQAEQLRGHTGRTTPPSHQAPVKTGWGTEFLESYGGGMCARQRSPHERSVLSRPSYT
jgi:hypothetical protein